MTLAIAAALGAATSQMTAVSTCAALDAEVLLSHVLVKDRAHLRAWPQRPLSAAQLAAFEALVDRRSRGEPVAYITGHREFWSLDLEVTPHTLTPRPETELLVELALQRLPVHDGQRVADLGTGTGAIALAIAYERPASRVVASDVSPGALAVAQRNARRLNIANVEFRAGDWFEPLRGERFHLLCCNPPYLRRDDPHLSAGDLAYEPGTALVAGVSGMEQIRGVIGGAMAHLYPEGWLIMEHGFDQGDAVLQALVGQGFEEISGHRDLAGLPRAASARARR